LPPSITSVFGKLGSKEAGRGTIGPQLLTDRRMTPPRHIEASNRPWSGPSLDRPAQRSPGRLAPLTGLGRRTREMRQRLPQQRAELSHWRPGSQASAVPAEGQGLTGIVCMTSQEGQGRHPKRGLPNERLCGFSWCQAYLPNIADSEVLIVLQNEVSQSHNLLCGFSWCHL
jgi:hypothetical protein